MRILLLYDTMDLPETQLIKGIDGSGIQMDVFCNPSGINQRILADSSINVAPLVCRSRVDLRAIYQIRKKLRSERYSIIHAFTSRSLSNVLIATIGLGYKPHIVAYRGAMGNVSWLDPTTQLTYRNSRVERINCVSDAVKNYLRASGLPESKLVRIYKGHNVEWYRSKPSVSRTSLGIPEAAILVGTVANMRPNKGVDVLLEAARSLALNKNIHFLLVGDVMDKRISALAADPLNSERLHFVGQRSDATQLIRCCDIFVMPSRYTEGLPKAVIEAMAQKVATIVTDVGGMPELVRDKVDGLIVPACNPAALAQAILTLAENNEQRATLGSAGAERIEQAFNIKQTVDETIEFYNDVLHVA